MLLVTDSQIVDEAMLGDINGLLNTGEITGLRCCGFARVLAFFAAISPRSVSTQVSTASDPCCEHGHYIKPLLQAQQVACLLPFQSGHCCAADLWQASSPMRSRLCCLTRSVPGWQSSQRLGRGGGLPGKPSSAGHATICMSCLPPAQSGRPSESGWSTHSISETS